MPSPWREGAPAWPTPLFPPGRLPCLRPVICVIAPRIGPAPRVRLVPLVDEDSTLGGAPKLGGRPRGVGTGVPGVARALFRGGHATPQVKRSPCSEQEEGCPRQGAAQWSRRGHPAPASCLLTSQPVCLFLCPSPAHSLDPDLIISGKSACARTPLQIPLCQRTPGSVKEGC